MMYKLLSQAEIHDDYPGLSETDMTGVPQEFLAEALFAAGSFYELEAAFGRVDGVAGTANGYFGGSTDKPSYREIIEGKTGHTEAVKVTYDKSKISYKSLCNIFWSSHDHTNKDYLRFGVDTHYQSAIFYANEEEKKQAQESKINKQMTLNKRIVTKILPISSSARFYLAETNHQKYYLQKYHIWLCASLSLRSSEQFAGCHLACKLNGILSGDQGSAAVEELKKFMGKHQLPHQTKLVLEEILQNLSMKLPTKN